MKIIKKLCTPLFSLVLVLGCFTASQLSGSAYTSSYVCTTHRVYMNLSRCDVTPNGLAPNGDFLYFHSHTYVCPVAGCFGSYDVCETLREDQPCVSAGGSHTHNYSTAWGEWKKISSCRLLG